MPSYRDLVLRPGEFFRQLTREPAGFTIPALIVLTAGILSAVFTYLMMSWMTGFFVTGYAASTPDPGEYASLFGFMVLMASTFAILGPFFTWAVAGIIFYLVSSLFSRTGSISHTLAATGWGMIPLAVYHAITLPLFLLFQKAITITISPEFFTALTNSTSAGSLDQGEMARMIVYNQPFRDYMVIDTTLNAVALLCCAWFWIHALQHTRSLDRRHAAITVLVPVLIYLAATIGMKMLRGGI